MLSYLADSNEVYRHSLPVNLTLRFIWMLLAVMAVSSFVDWVRGIRLDKRRA
jgi:hypothetical protein